MKKEEKLTFGPVCENPILEHGYGGSRGVTEGSHIGSIVETELELNYFFLRHLSLPIPIADNNFNNMVLWKQNNNKVQIDSGDSYNKKQKKNCQRHTKPYPPIFTLSLFLTLFLSLAKCIHTNRCIYFLILSL